MRVTMWIGVATWMTLETYIYILICDHMIISDHLERGGRGEGKWFQTVSNITRGGGLTRGWESDSSFESFWALRNVPCAFWKPKTIENPLAITSGWFCLGGFVLRTREIARSLKQFRALRNVLRARFGNICSVLRSGLFPCPLGQPKCYK